MKKNIKLESNRINFLKQKKKYNPVKWKEITKPIIQFFAKIA